MRDKKLLQYLEYAIEMEKTVYVQDRLIDELKSKIAHFGIRKDIPYPTESHSSMKECFEMSSSGGVVIGAVIGAIVGLITGNGLLGKIIQLIFKGIVYMLVGGMIGVVTTPIWYGIGYAAAGSRLKNAMEEREAAVYHDKERVKKELKQAANLKIMLAELEAKHNESKSFLNAYYAKGPIHREYQDVVALCSIYQYFDTGRCSSLEGPYGAYNKYEEERRLNRICTALDKILENLNQIKIYQCQLYNVLQEGNRKMDRLLDESIRQSNTLQTISDQNAVIEYNSGIAKRELEMQTWLKTYEMTKQGY